MVCLQNFYECSMFLIEQDIFNYVCVSMHYLHIVLIFWCLLQLKSFAYLLAFSLLCTNMLLCFSRFSQSLDRPYSFFTFFLHRRYDLNYLLFLLDFLKLLCISFTPNYSFYSFTFLLFLRYKHIAVIVFISSVVYRQLPNNTDSVPYVGFTRFPCFRFDPYLNTYNNLRYPSVSFTATI